MDRWKNDTPELALLRDRIRTEVNQGWHTFHFLVENGHHPESASAAWVKRMIAALEKKAEEVDRVRQGLADVSSLGLLEEAETAIVKGTSR